MSDLSPEQRAAKAIYELVRSKPGNQAWPSWEDRTEHQQESWLRAARAALDDPAHKPEVALWATETSWQARCVCGWVSTAQHDSEMSAWHEAYEHRDEMREGRSESAHHALRTFLGAVEAAIHGASYDPGAMRAAKAVARAALAAASPSSGASRAKTEQEFENEQVRKMQQTGRCPCCGADA
jgi:hypothetical protein